MKTSDFLASIRPSGTDTRRTPSKAAPSGIIDASDVGPSPTLVNRPDQSTVAPGNDPAAVVNAWRSSSATLNAVERPSQANPLGRPISGGQL